MNLDDNLIKWKKVDKNLWKWVKVNENRYFFYWNGRKWIKLGESGWKRMKFDQSG